MSKLSAENDARKFFIAIDLYHTDKKQRKPHYGGISRSKVSHIDALLV